jgi:isoleucyl-tRNA synthetase
MPSPPSPFEKLPESVSFPAIEAQVIDLWRELDAFRESNRRREGGPEFVFYDGPPFATGTPHYGHLLVSTIKDMVARYWCMRGYHVERRFGWDCHGLPIESLAQQALGLKGAPDIRRIGTAAFNEQCRSMVLTYVAEWRSTITRLGRWVDFDNDYKTMDPSFMESVWWVFKQLWDQNRIYKAHRIVAYSWKLTTPLSNLEAGMNYKEIQDPAITVRFRLTDTLGTDGPLYALAWTTTPWTLPSNLALCVGPDIVYEVVREHASGDHYLLAQERVAAYDKNRTLCATVATLHGRDLVGNTYAPLFPYFSGRKNTFRVLADDFVSTSEGTGIVHMAPAYGEDDYRICRREGIDLVDPLDEECKFTAQVPDYQGQFCKDADKAIIRRLKDEGKLYQQATLVHTYPFCYRTDTPLIYRAIDAWYVRIEDLRDKMADQNKSIRWVPEAVGQNRFGNWIRDARDWNISRNRYWGSCLPVWASEDGKDMICVGSVAELEELSGVRVTDLHKHVVDEIEFVVAGKRYRRIPEVLDCWFESGAMPYGQKHYPFENQTSFEANFPADFIAEALDQTRAWFYYLLVLSTALFGKPSFKNVVVNGLVLAEDGSKMSKSKKNYPDPVRILDEVGADPLRAYLINSPVVRAEPLRFSEAGLREVVRQVVRPYWSALSFFTMYAIPDGFRPGEAKARTTSARPELDRFILSALESLVADVNREMEGYRLYNVVPRLISFIDLLTNWYVRLSRRRFWKSEDDADKADAYATLYEVLVTFAKVMAPFLPFLSEYVYRHLVVSVDAKAPASVHFCDFPQPDTARIDVPLEKRMAMVRSIVGLARKLREDQKLKVRQPLASLTVVSRDPEVTLAARSAAALIADELNVKKVETSSNEASYCTWQIKPNFAALRERAATKLKPIGEALKVWGFDEIGRLEAGQSLEAAGVPLSIGDVLLNRVPRSGSVVASAGSVMVVLDPKLSPELIEEGLAREFNSVLQQARKAKGLDVTDRIRVGFASPDRDVVTAIDRYRQTISDEVLAIDFRHDESSGESADLNGRPVRYSIEKAEHR